MRNIYKMIYLSLMISMALVLSLIDSRIPLLPALPGIKMGLANIAIMVVINFFGWKDALLVSIIRCLLTWFFHGSPVALILSLAGGISSTLLMSLLSSLFSRHFSLIGISISGAVVHNLSQLAVTLVIIPTPYLLSYMPYLIVAGVVSGYCTGLLYKRIVRIVSLKVLHQL